MTTQAIQAQIDALQAQIQQAESDVRIARKQLADDNPPVYEFTIEPEKWDSLIAALGGIRINAQPTAKSAAFYREHGLMTLDQRNSVSYVWYDGVLHHGGGGFIVLDFGQTDSFAKTCPCSESEWNDIKSGRIPTRFLPKSWILTPKVN